MLILDKGIKSLGVRGLLMNFFLSKLSNLNFEAPETLWTNHCTLTKPYYQREVVELRALSRP